MVSFGRFGNEMSATLWMFGSALEGCVGFRARFLELFSFGVKGAAITISSVVRHMLLGGRIARTVEGFGAGTNLARDANRVGNFDWFARRKRD